MSYVNYFARGFVLTIFVTLLTGISGYLLRILLARNFTPAEFGLFFSILSLPTLFSTLKHFGAGAPLVKELKEALIKNKLNYVKSLINGFLLLELLSYGITIIILLLSAKYLAIYYYKEPSSLGIIIILIISSFFTIFDVAFYGFYLAKKNIRFISFINGLRPLLVLVFAIIAIKLNKTLTSLALSYLVATIIITIINFIPYSRFSRKIPEKGVKIPGVTKKLFFSGLPVFAGITGSAVLANIDTIILTATRTLTEVGIYNTAIPTASLARQIVKTVMFLIPPVITELFITDKTRFGFSISRIQKYSIIITIPGIVFLIIFSSWLLKRFFGADYITGSLALQILSFGALFSMIFNINTNIILGIGKYTTYAKISIIIAIISTLLNIILSPYLGINGAAIANTISFITGAIISTLIIYKICKYEIPLNETIKAAISGFIMYLVIIFILPRIISLYWIIISSILGFIIYLILLLITKAITLNEIKKIIKQINFLKFVNKDVIINNEK